MNAYLTFMLFTLVVSIIGMSHLNLSDEDKENLAKKPLIYQKFIQFCRASWIILAIGCVLWIAADGLGSRDGGDCDYDSHGRHCYPD